MTKSSSRCGAGAEGICSGVPAEGYGCSSIGPARLEETCVTREGRWERFSWCNRRSMLVSGRGAQAGKAGTAGSKAFDWGGVTTDHVAVSSGERPRVDSRYHSITDLFLPAEACAGFFPARSFFLLRYIPRMLYVIYSMMPDTLLRKRSGHNSCCLDLNCRRRSR